MPELLTQNAKMRKSSLPGLWNFGIPAFREAGGRVTCPMAGQCGHAAGCYAQMGRYVQGAVKNAYQWRYDQTQRPDFVRVMAEELQKKKYRVIRVHDSGDFYSPKYLEAWMLIANQSPHKAFYAHTKMVEQARRMPLLPNWTWIFSLGGKQDHLIDLERDRHSRVFQSVKELKAAGYADASEDDAVALGKNPKIGLVYHGYSSRASLWGK